MLRIMAFAKKANKLMDYSCIQLKTKIKNNLILFCIFNKNWVMILIIKFCIIMILLNVHHDVIPYLVSLFSKRRW